MKTNRGAVESLLYDLSEIDESFIGCCEGDNLNQVAS